MHQPVLETGRSRRRVFVRTASNAELAPPQYRCTALSLFCSGARKLIHKACAMNTPDISVGTCSVGLSWFAKSGFSGSIGLDPDVGQ